MLYALLTFKFTHNLTFVAAGAFTRFPSTYFQGECEIIATPRMLILTFENSFRNCSRDLRTRRHNTCAAIVNFAAVEFPPDIAAAACCFEKLLADADETLGIGALEVGSVKLYNSAAGKSKQHHILCLSYLIHDHSYLQ